MRIRELSKELGLSNNEIIKKLKELGITGKVASSGITAEEEEMLRELIAEEKEAAKAKEAPVQKPEEKKPAGDSDKTGRNERNDRNDRPNRGQGRQNRNNKGGAGNGRPGGNSNNSSNNNSNNNSNSNGGNAGNNKNNKNKPGSSNGSVRAEKPEPPKHTAETPKTGADFGNHKKNKKKKKPAPAPVPEPEPIEEEDDISVIELGATVTVGDLAEKLGKKSSEIIMKLMAKGIMASINQEIERDLAEKICEDYGVIVEEEVEKDIAEEIFASEEDDEADLVERPPVVVVMGHVDHGKTSLLDAIRKTKVTAGEAGGITQHIGAYTVSINGKPITFLDTPGHEAFTAMRMRGALVTDIAVLVVAADDGVMPQTVEAINHAKAAGVDIIVAINKVDKPSANPERVKQELVEYGLIVEDWGGDTIAVPVSAVTKEGIDQLLEMIILVAEMKELKANPNKRASGNIIEARLDKGRGPVATALVKAGTLKVGDPVVVGGTYGKVRAMVNDKGKQIKKAGPSVPVEILGLNDVPHAGDMFYVAKNDKQARQVAESVIAKARVDMLKGTQKVSLEDLFSQIQSGNMKELNIVIKADVQGSVEAVRASLEKLSNDEVRIKTIHGGVGAITESDVMLASASNAIIIGFNVRPESSAKSVAEDQKVDIRLYRVIYNAIDDITAAIKGMLDPEYVEKILGHAEVRQTFNASGVGTIAGSYVKDGKITRNSKIRLLRDNVIVYEGEVSNLRRYKDDVKEVATNFECGILLNKFNDVKIGDIIEAFTMEEIKR
ncbi:MAG: translation initiation factor IF-2 [Clostridiales bacterium]|nr:translation initiation factor IF-2 [Clostridiales bacterium]